MGDLSGIGRTNLVTRVQTPLFGNVLFRFGEKAALLPSGKKWATCCQPSADNPGGRTFFLFQ
jgi:hypothetical protein